MKATASEGRVRITGGPLNMSPDAARELATELIAEADKAQAHVDFNYTPGAVYHDQHGNFYIVGVSSQSGYGESQIWKLRAKTLESRQGATRATRKYWEETEGVQFSRVMTGTYNRIAPLGGKGGL